MSTGAGGAAPRAQWAAPRGRLGKVLDSPRWAGVVLVVVLAMGLAGLQNGHWRPIPDAGLYLMISRSLVGGEGFTVAGLPVRMVPPGWPMVLAGALAVSRSFWLLNAIPLVCWIGFAYVSYRILLRLARPAVALGASLLGCLLFESYQLSALLLSDALGALLVAGAVLVALQINEAPRPRWRLALLAGLCAAMVAVRWTGVVGWVLVAGALLHGRPLRPRLEARWAAVALSAVAAGGCFVGLRAAQYGTLSLGVRTAPLPKSAGLSAEAIGAMGVEAISIAQENRDWHVLGRMGRTGDWLFTLVLPVVPAGDLAGASLLAWPNLAGWALAAIIAVAAASRLRRREWLWAGVGLFVLVLTGWCLPVVPRYLVIVAPPLLAGLAQGMARLARLGPAWWGRCWSAARWALLGAIVLVNLGLLGADVYVAQSRDFYAAYLAGEDDRLVDISAYLLSERVGDRQVATNGLLRAPGLRARVNLPAMRMVSALTGTTFLTAPAKLADQPTAPELADWARQHGVRYYVYQPVAAKPWRVWHFRPAWLAGNPRPDPLLYGLTDQGLAEVAVPAVQDWPRFLPEGPANLTGPPTRP